MIVLGLNAFHGDSSAAVLRYGRLTCAVEEERINRIKHWAGLPVEAARLCLAGDVPDHVAISRNVRAHLLRKLARAIATPRNWRKVAGRVDNGIRVERVKDALLQSGIASRATRLHFVEHHRAHLASAVLCSPFDHAAVVSVDGFGDFSSTMWGLGEGNKIDVRGSVLFPHSLGIFYTAFTQLLGFMKYGDEYKMMGLSAYGEPRFKAQAAKLIHIADGRIRLNLDYFSHHSQGVDMTWANGEPHLGSLFSPRMAAEFGPARAPGDELQQRHKDLAASVQAVLEDVYLTLLNHVHAQTGKSAVCLAGGVALNCVANGRILERTPFKDVYVQPASNDAGTSIGAALYVQHQVLGQPRQFVMSHVYYGPESSDPDILSDLEASGARWHRLAPAELIRRTAQELADGAITGWFQGRMEFGPRALGNRSILADPRRHDIKDILNRRIKYREPFRPFCPSILAERAHDFFETDYPSPFMVMAYKIRPKQRDRVPGIVHQDGTGRLQTVEKNVNPLYWNLISQFNEITGVPMLLNTSFNENEPIVHRPAEAIDCFLRTRMDVLAIGPYLLLKRENFDVRHAGQEQESTVLR